MKIVTFLLTLLLFFNGCTTKEIVPKYIYIKPEYPTLHTFENNQTLNLSIKTIKVDGIEKVCVKEWDACVKKEPFMEIVNLIKSKNESLNKCNKQIEIFNEEYKKENNGNK